MIDRNPFADGYDDAVEASPEETPTVEPRAQAYESGVSRIPAAEYHDDPAPVPSLSATLAKLALAKSMKHAWHACRRLNPDWQPVNKKTFDMGRAAHRVVLGFGDDYVPIPEHVLAKNGAASTDAAKAFIEAQRAIGNVPLKAEEVDQVETMGVIAAAKLAEHGVTLDPARSELSAIAQIDGVWCRAMFDNVDADPSGPIWDFKTCEDASPEACLRAIVNYGYDVQAEHYRAVWKAATGQDRPFVFIFQEKPEPNEVTLIRLSGSFQELAQRRAKKARKLWGDCIRTGIWPGYPIGMHEVDPPAWAIDRFEEAA